MLDSVALAAILDHERKVPGWWKKDQPNFGPPQSLDTLPWTFTGPPNLHTAREHAWRMEEWLEARNCRVTICRDGHICTMIYYFDKSEDRYLAVTDPNHTAALVAAIERIANG